MQHITAMSAYAKPTLARFGTFRELTRVGTESGSDLGSVFGIPGCDAADSDADFGCGAGGGSR